VIELESLGVRLGGRQIVDGIDATVAAGEWVTLIGPNGAGKTTLLRALAALVPYSGSARVGGDEVSSLSRRELARRLAFVPQTPVLPAAMRVSEYVLLGRTPHVGTFGYESRHDHDAARRALDQLELRTFANRHLATLSGGEQQRVVLARALAQEASLLVLDEPTTSLDVGRQQQVLELVVDLRERRELTVLSAMHDLTLAIQYTDRLALLAEGRVVAVGRPDEVATEALIATHYGAEVEVVQNGTGPVAIVPRRVRR
jgi:iron complex transport system ATP-binding protein